MADIRDIKLAENILDYSLKIQPGEKIWIQGTGIKSIPMMKSLIKLCYQRSAIPYYFLEEPELLSEFQQSIQTDQVKTLAQRDAELMKEMDCFIGIRAMDNRFEMTGVPQDRTTLWLQNYLDPVHKKVRIDKTRWVVLRYPTPAMAQSFGLNTKDFEDFYYRVSTLDYAKLSQAMDPLVELMEKTKKVRIKGPDRDLRFSIEGIPVVKCDGHRNIPDGEVYTAPVKDSVEGYLKYNTPSLYQGKSFSDIYFEFSKGKIVEAHCNNTREMMELLDMDEGARYIGEFALGVNPFIKNPMMETLFDEKISGSFHLTPGNCYTAASNGNHSSIHWDLVTIERPEYGGGEIWFDDLLVRKDGIFLPESLKPLNSENFTG